MDTSTTGIYTLSLHDALPIFLGGLRGGARAAARLAGLQADLALGGRERGQRPRSEEHTSELQSRQYLVCRLLLEKKKVNQVRGGSPRSLRPLSAGQCFLAE